MKCREIILSNANENWYIILYDLFSRLWYIATCGPFCKDATHIYDVQCGVTQGCILGFWYLHNMNNICNVPNVFCSLLHLDICTENHNNNTEV